MFIWTALALFGEDRLMFCCLQSLCDGALSQYHKRSVLLAVVKTVCAVCSTVGQHWLEIPNVVTELLCGLVSQVSKPLWFHLQSGVIVATSQVVEPSALLHYLISHSAWRTGDSWPIVIPSTFKRFFP